METTKGLIIAERYRTLLNKNGINTLLRLSYFIANIHHESGFKAIRESLYYKNIQGLRNTFYTPFKGKSDAFVSQYLRNSEKCANYVYANRGGNGNEASGDGFKFRGGGFIQNTFKDAYKALTKATGINFLDYPDAIANEANAMIAALWFWDNNNLNAIADKDNNELMTKAINGGKNGIQERGELVEEYKKLFK